ncbi:MAG: hypothetical protein M1280_03105 [Actinobacteria bacterium]|nr:hypothetical protein [Actinomycetota bacterium]
MSKKLLILLTLITLLLTACGTSKVPAVKAPSAAVTRKEVNAAYQSFFNLHNPSLSAKLNVIQDGAKLHSAISTAMSSSLAKDAGGARVSTITPYTKSQCANAALIYPCAKVGYSILSPTGSVLTSGAGYAVYSNGKWLVAKATVCGLLSLFEEYAGSKTPIAGCS